MTLRDGRDLSVGPLITMQRHLDWEGCFNVRDLGGLPTTDGRETRWGRLVRADGLEGLTGRGWAALEAHGVRTVIDLRNNDEVAGDAAPRPDSIATVHVPLDGTEDREFWDAWDSGPQFATPLYFGPHLERLPERTARVVSTIADAPSGGVVFHCVSGRDRSGLIAMVALALVGVEPEHIAGDYELSARRLPARYSARGEEDQGPIIDRFLQERGTTARAVVLETLAAIGIEACLRAGGLEDRDVAALRRRLLDP